MNILALDLATTTGYAVFSGGRFSESGVQKNSIGAAEQRGHRWLKFRQFLTELKQRHGEFHAVYFEEVKNHGKNAAYSAQVYGGFRAHLETWCALQNVPLHGVECAKIKKHWTGKGNAKKPEMVAEAQARGFKPRDDNEADALAILAYGLNAEGLVRQAVREAA